jgi:hypothetical protein
VRVFISVPHGGDWTTAAFTLAYYLVFFAWGSALRARRLLVVKLREDAERERADHVPAPGFVDQSASKTVAVIHPDRRPPVPRSYSTSSVPHHSRAG